MIRVRQKKAESTLRETKIIEIELLFIFLPYLSLLWIFSIGLVQFGQYMPDKLNPIIYQATRRKTVINYFHQLFFVLIFLRFPD